MSFKKVPTMHAAMTSCQSGKQLPTGSTRRILLTHRSTFQLEATMASNMKRPAYYSALQSTIGLTKGESSSCHISSLFLINNHTQASVRAKLCDCNLDEGFDFAKNFFVRCFYDSYKGDPEIDCLKSGLGHVRGFFCGPGPGPPCRSRDVLALVFFFF